MELRDIIKQNPGKRQAILREAVLQMKDKKSPEEIVKYLISHLDSRAKWGEVRLTLYKTGIASYDDSRSIIKKVQSESRMRKLTSKTVEEIKKAASEV